MKADDLIKLLAKNGWQFVRQRGSHRIYKHPENPANISVPGYGKDEIATGTTNQILKKAGLK